MYTRSLRPVCLVVALLAGLASLSAGGAGPSQPSEAKIVVSASVSSGILKPGAVALLTVTASPAAASIEGDAWGRSIGFWPGREPGQWLGLLGVGLGTAPGSYRVSIRGRGPGGDTATAHVSVRVESRRFETRRIRVEPRLVNPPDEEAERIAEETKAMATAFATMTPDRLWRGRFEAPVPGAANSSFGRLTVTNGQPAGRHQGTDFRAATGTPVRAPNAGRVVLARNLYFAGNTVILDHGLGVFSLLAHLSTIGVDVGAQVSRGGVLGESGATGRVTGPHVHWAVRFGDTSIDPLSLIDALAALADEGVPSDPPPSAPGT